MEQARHQYVVPESSGQPMSTDRDDGENPTLAGRATGKHWGRPLSPTENGKHLRIRQVTTLRRLMNSVTVGELLQRPRRAVRTTTEIEDLATVFANSLASVVAVLDDDGVLCGVVTRDALLQRYAPFPRQRSPRGPDVSLEQTRESALVELTAADLMTREAGAMAADTPLGLVVALIAFSGQGCIPVVQGPNEAFLGLLTQADVVRWLAETSGCLR